MNVRTSTNTAYNDHFKESFKHWKQHGKPLYFGTHKDGGKTHYSSSTEKPDKSKLAKARSSGNTFEGTGGES